MSAQELASAHFEKAAHARKCAAARMTVSGLSMKLACLAQEGKPRSELGADIDRVLAAFKEQLELIVEAAAIDRRIREAEVES